MRRLAIICALLTSACNRPEPEVIQTYVPADLLTPCDTPPMRAETERELARKMLRIAQDRDCANQKITSIDAILTSETTAQ
jgi:hypothetical protein